MSENKVKGAIRRVVRGVSHLLVMISSVVLMVAVAGRYMDPQELTTSTSFLIYSLAGTTITCCLAMLAVLLLPTPSETEE